MKRVTKHIFVLFVMIVFSLSVFGQNPDKIENELVGLYKKIADNSAYSSNPNYDLLEKAQEDFKQKILQYTKLDSTLNHKFSVLGKSIIISTSEDGKLRTYSWDREDGGTMHFFETVHQFQDKDGKVYSTSNTLEEGDSGSFVYEIFTLDTNNGKVYLACSTSIFSTSGAYQSVKLLKIENKEIYDKLNLIKTKMGLKNSIGFAYDFFSVVDRKERPIKLILYEKSTNSVKIPLVLEDKKFLNGKVTDKYIVYTFNGTYFVKVK